MDEWLQQVDRSLVGRPILDTTKRHGLLRFAIGQLQVFDNISCTNRVPFTPDSTYPVQIISERPGSRASVTVLNARLDSPQGSHPDDAPNSRHATERKILEFQQFIFLNSMRHSRSFPPVGLKSIFTGGLSSCVLKVIDSCPEPTACLGLQWAWPRLFTSSHSHFPTFRDLRQLMRESFCLFCVPMWRETVKRGASVGPYDCIGQHLMCLRRAEHRLGCSFNVALD